MNSVPRPICMYCLGSGEGRWPNTSCRECLGTGTDGERDRREKEAVEKVDRPRNFNSRWP